ncbi:hypothetical protein OIU74_012885 [Salix koriyanagi]|uniref:Uncharacterized protein n=1 Tax=Salix koriyanagi TaxID=2511006 RepID=A0A9Q0Q7R0_9ROSI|nr:hypothetical protein OIU74_012885 [Salix koriyanagi]
MLAAVPKKPHPLAQSFGCEGGKLVPSFCSEPMFSFLFLEVETRNFCFRVVSSFIFFLPNDCSKSTIKKNYRFN